MWKWLDGKTTYILGIAGLLSGLGAFLKSLAEKNPSMEALAIAWAGIMAIRMRAGIKKAEK